MDQEKINDKLKRLENIDKKNRERVKRYLKKRESEGKKQISAIISRDAYEEICKRRSKSILAESPLSAGDIIEQALLYTKEVVNSNGHIDVDINDNTIINADININENINDQKNPLEFNENRVPPHWTEKEAYKEYTLSKIIELKDAGLSASQIVIEFEKQELKSLRGKEKWHEGIINKMFRSYINQTL